MKTYHNSYKFVLKNLVKFSKTKAENIFWKYEFLHILKLLNTLKNTSYSKTSVEDFHGSLLGSARKFNKHECWYPHKYHELSYKFHSVAKILINRYELTKKMLIILYSFRENESL